MNPRCLASLFVGCVGTLAFSHAAFGATVIVHAQVDTTLREIAPAEINGSFESLKIGTLGATGQNMLQRGLFQFDVAGFVPLGAVITSARLTLTVTRAPDAEARDFQLHRMLTNWNETAATWLNRDTDQPWSIPGGTNGPDCIPSSSAVALVAGPGQYTWDSTPQLVADVQGWLDNPAANFGWMLRQSNEAVGRSARLVSTRESTSGPALVITYSDPLRINSTGLVNNQFCLTFTGRAGRIYRIEHRPLVNAGTWGSLVTLPPAQADGPVTICVTMSGTARFYRVADITP